MIQHASRAILTPAEIAATMRVNTTTVSAWIRRGELPAIIISKNPDSKKPRYRVWEEDFKAFLARRTAQAEVKQLPPIKRRRRRQPPEGYGVGVNGEFFKRYI